MLVTTHQLITKVHARGLSIPGPIIAPGLKVRDLVFSVWGSIDNGLWYNRTCYINSIFESRISIEGQIQQLSGGDLSVNDFVFLICPAGPGV